MSDAKERPILFSDEMVRAILEGRKTQTRRVIDPRLAKQYEGMALDNEKLMPLLRNPYGTVGDRLWVRESYAVFKWEQEFGCLEIKDIPKEFREPGSPYRLVYRATSQPLDDRALPPWRWNPPLFMPRWASRITLEITEVRIERVQDISEEDAKAEACPYISGSKDVIHASADIDRFRHYWDKLNGDRDFRWEANPWVRVIGFRRLTS